MVYSTLLFHVDIAVNTYVGKTSYCKFLQKKKRLLFSFSVKSEVIFILFFFLNITDFEHYFLVQVKISRQ